MIRGRPETNVKNPPGQIKPDQTLGDYLHRKYPEKVVQKKLTFDEWWHQNNDEHTYYERDRKIWKAAQENK